MLQQPTSFQTAVQGLFMAQRQAVSAGTPGCGKHLCFIGSGREQEDQYVHMVVASFLQRGTAYVSLAKGGFQGEELSNFNFLPYFILLYLYKIKLLVS